MSETISIFDPTELGLDPDEQVQTDRDNYQASTTFFRPAPPGRYEFVAIPDTKEWGRSSNKNDLYVRFSAEQVNEPYAGMRADAFVSAGKNQFRNASDLEDLAFALTKIPISSMPTSLEEVGKLVDEGLANGAVFLARQSWEGYCRKCGKTVFRTGGKGKDGRPIDFPKDGKGEYIHFANCPNCGETVGARGRLTAYYVA